MRTVAHLSDLHFGRTSTAMVRALQEALAGLRPDLVLISGDFTQRAKVSEYQEARAFLDALPAPYLAVPGNHDVPLYDVFRRFVQPLQRYKRYISPVVEPLYSDDEVTVVCVNTARSLTVKDGRINAEQVRRVLRELDASGSGKVRILMGHHPLDLPDDFRQPLAARSRMALATLANHGLDVLLSGHLHLPRFPKAAERLRVGGHTALLVQAGTAVSTRSRGAVNSFNLLELEYEEIGITQHGWVPEDGAFAALDRARYRRVDSGWARVEETSS